MAEKWRVKRTRDRNWAVYHGNIIDAVFTRWRDAMSYARWKAIS